MILPNSGSMHSASDVSLMFANMSNPSALPAAQVTLHGRAMTVERPQDYVDPAKQAQAAQLAQLTLAALHQPGSALPSPSMSLPGPPPLPNMGSLPPPP